MFQTLLNEWLNEKPSRPRMTKMICTHIDLLKEFADWLDLHAVEHSMQTDQKGQNTIKEINPGDWISLGGRLYWICSCRHGMLNDEDWLDCDGSCGDRRPAKPAVSQSAPSGG